MGGGKGGGTSTTNNISKTEIPPEVLARYNAVNARAEAVAQQPYQRYSNDPNAFVAGLTPTQQAGIQNTNIMAGAAQPFYQAGAAATLGGMQNVGPLTQQQIEYYQNPYTQAVVNPTLQALQQQQRQQLAEQQAQAIRGGAFGGDRAGLARAQLMGQQNLAQAQAIAPLYQQGYNTALQTAAGQQNVIGADLARMMTGGQQLANLGMGAQQAGLAGAQAQMAAGQAQQQTEQAGKQAMYNQFMQEQGYPFQVAQFLANIATGTGALSGNTTAGTSTTTTQGGGGFFSDERLKENIKKVGETNDGQPIYRYNYKGDPRTQIGLLAQDVEKEHPEAVGLAGGYKTVDYKKATDGAVRKADGGAMGDDAYSMDAPSQMLNKPAGLGALQLPQMVTGAGIPVRSMTPASEIAGLLAPKATGFSPGTLESARAQRASLGSALEGGDEEKLKMGSGRGYIQSEYDRLGKFLEPYGSQYSSQGGLVGPEGGAFSRGGYAFGGGPYGVELTPMQQRQVLQGTPMSAPQVQQRQADPLGDATKVAGLVSGGYKLYKDRPDFLRSAEDVANRQREEAYRKAVREEYLKKHGIEPKTDETGGGGPEDLEGGDEFARGGLAGSRQGFYGNGYVNPQSYVSGVLQEQSEAPPPRKLANSAADFAKPQKPQEGGGLGDIINAGMKLNSLRKGGEWAAGKLGLGVPETAMSATSTGMIPEVIDLTSGAGLAAGVPEVAAAAVPEAVGAGAAALAPELLTAGLAEGAASALPFLFFLKNGGAVPHRKNYQTRGLVPPEDAAEGGGDTTTTGGDGTTIVGRSARLPVTAKSVPTPADAVAAAPAPRAPGVASGSRPSIPDVGGLLPEGMKDTLSSENFWVPALAGIGSMLASPNKTFLGAVGSGLVGGTTAYTGLQKQQSEIAKNSLDVFNKIFEKREDGDGNISYMNLQTGQPATPQEAFSFLKKMPGFSNLAAAPSVPAREAPQRDATVALAGDVVDKGVEPVAPRIPTTAAARVTQNAPAETTVATPGAPAAGVTPTPSVPAAAATAAAKPEEGEQSTIRIPEAAQTAILKADAWARSQPDVKEQLAEAELQSRIADRAQAAMRKPLTPEIRANLAKQFEVANAQAREARSRAEAAVTRLTAPILTDISKQLGVSPEAVAGAARMEAGKARAVLAPDIVAGQAEAAGAKARSEAEAKAQVEEDTVVRTDPTTGVKYRLPLDRATKKPIIEPPAEPPLNGAPAPKKAEIDPETRAVIPGRPKPPKGGGMPIAANLPGNAIVVGDLDDTSRELIKKDAEFYSDMLNKSEAVTVGSQRYNTITNAFKLFQSGPGAAPLAEYAAIAKSWGQPGLAEKIFDGKPEAVAVLQKQAPGLVLEQLKAATPRFAQSEFTALLDKAVPDAGRLPEANFEIVAEGLAIMNRSHAFLDSWADAQADGWRSMSAYYREWSKANPMAAYLQSAKLQMGNFAGMPIPPEDKLAVGATYVTPKELDQNTKAAFGALGIQPGDIWRYNGRGKNPTVIPKADMFSVYMGY